MKKSICIISELYYPEDTSTGYFVTGIAEGLATTEDFEVSVLCAQPSYSKKGFVALKREQRNRVQIKRLNSPRCDKNKLLGRAWIFLVLTWRFFWHLLRTIKQGDVVLVLTNPPSLPLLVAVLAFFKKARPYLLVHDVYPEVLIPTGFIREGSFIFRLICLPQNWMFNRMHGTVVLGRDMKVLIQGKLRLDRPAPVVIPNWGDAELIHPKHHANNPLRVRLGLENKFIVQFSGNLGRTHGLDDLLGLADRWKECHNVAFLVFGWGAGKSWLEGEIKRRKLTNIRLLDACSREDLPVYLSACDLFFLAFKKGMEGISVPSRLYNVMAAGNPILAVAAGNSELAQVVKEESIGWVRSPGDLDGISQALDEALREPEQIELMRKRSRSAMESYYTRDAVLNRYLEFFSKVKRGHE